MTKNSKVKFSEDMQNISRSKSFGKFVLIVQIQTFMYDKSLAIFGNQGVFHIYENKRALKFLRENKI